MIVSQHEGSSALAKSIIMLSVPNIALVFIQSSLILVESYYLGLLGDRYLIMLAFITPLYMLMLMLGSGTFSAASSSVVARHLGADQYSHVKLCGTQGVAFAFAAGVIFFVCVLVFGPLLGAMFDRAMAGALPDQTYQYAIVLFLSAPAIFTYNALSGIMRGAGEMVFPASISATTAVVSMIAMPIMMFGLGPIDGLGIVGVAAALTFCNYFGLLVLARRVYTDQRPFMPDLRWVWRRDVMAELLAVAAPTALLSVLNLAAFASITFVMAQMGEAGAAAYGAIGRVEFTVMVLSFAVGVAIIREVGVRFGAGRLGDARRAAWISATLVAALVSIPATTLWFAPSMWLDQFLDDPAAIAVGSTYIGIAAPTYIAFAFGLAWLFVAQATGALKGAFLASVLRVLVIVALAFAMSAAGVSPVVAAGLATAAGSMLYAIVMPVVHRRIFIPTGGADFVDAAAPRARVQS